MKVQEWIDNKCNELISNKTFKEVKLRCVDKCKMSRFMTSSIYGIGAKDIIDFDMELRQMKKFGMI